MKPPPNAAGSSVRATSSRARAALSSTPQLPPRTSLIDSLALAAAAAFLSDQKKGVDIRVLDVREHLQIADYFVIVTGLSRPQIRALHKELHARLKAAGAGREHTEGVELGWWILMDYGDVVVHLLQPEAREYYNLDALYRDCKPIEWRDVSLPELPQRLRAAE